MFDKVPKTGRIMSAKCLVLVCYHVTHCGKTVLHWGRIFISFIDAHAHTHRLYK